MNDTAAAPIVVAVALGVFAVAVLAILALAGASWPTVVWTFIGLSAGSSALVMWWDSLVRVRQRRRRRSKLGRA